MHLPSSGETDESHGLPHEEANPKKSYARLATNDPPVPYRCLIQRHCAAAESVNSLYKKELIEREGPWHNVRDVALATMEWVSWYNSHRLHSACGNIPPKEFEDNYYMLPGTLVA
jgi:hypothetical protein